MRVLDHGRGFLLLSVVQGKECLVKVACKNMAKRNTSLLLSFGSTASRESCVVAGTVLAIREKREAQLVTFGDEDFGHEEQSIVFRSMDWRFILTRGCLARPSPVTVAAAPHFLEQLDLKGPESRMRRCKKQSNYRKRHCTTPQLVVRPPRGQYQKRRQRQHNMRQRE